MAGSSARTPVRQGTTAGEQSLPIELRDIVFTPKEARDALHAYAQMQEMEIDGKPLDVQLTEGTDVIARLIFDKGQLSFSTHEVTAALLLYAQRSNIPIPRRAQKELRVHKGQLGLRLRMT